MCNNVLNKNDRGMRIEVVRMSKRSIVVRWNVLRSTLGSLRPQLHHQEHQRIATAADPAPSAYWQTLQPAVAAGLSRFVSVPMPCWYSKRYSPQV
jgi:hypothetical protein